MKHWDEILRQFNEQHADVEGDLSDHATEAMRKLWEQQPAGPDRARTGTNQGGQVNVLDEMQESTRDLIDAQDATNERVKALEADLVAEVLGLDSRIAALEQNRATKPLECPEPTSGTPSGLMRVDVDYFGRLEALVRDLSELEPEIMYEALDSLQARARELQP